MGLMLALSKRVVEEVRWTWRCFAEIDNNVLVKHPPNKKRKEKENHPFMLLWEFTSESNVLIFIMWVFFSPFLTSIVAGFSTSAFIY